MKLRLVISTVFVLFVLFLTACGGSTAASGSQDVQVNLSDFKIASSVTSFSAGTNYHFVVANKGKTDHEFMIMPSSMGMSNMSMDDMHKVALAHIEHIPPGETKTLDYTFASSTKGSHPEFACHFPGHYEAGMKLDVQVQ